MFGSAFGEKKHGDYIFSHECRKKMGGKIGKGAFYIEHFPLPIFVHHYWFTGVHILPAPQLEQRKRWAIGPYSTLEEEGSCPLFLKYMCFLAIIVLYTEGKAWWLNFNKLACLALNRQDILNCRLKTKVRFFGRKPRHKVLG